jgi:uncharacterized membrane protein
VPWFQIFLFLHVLTAIVAFGPSFTFPLIGRMGAAEPQHGNFSMRLSEAIEKRIVIPAALTMPITGVAMILAAGIDWQQPWLGTAIAIYVIAIVFAVAIQTRWVGRVIQLTSGAPGAQGVAAPMPAGPGAAVAGPPPEVLAAVKRVQRGGMFLTVCIVAIVLLMVFRPMA